MEGWKDGRMEGWKDGRMEGWKDGRMEGWKDGRMEGWKDGRMEGWKDGRMEGWKDGICSFNTNYSGIPLYFSSRILRSCLCGLRRPRKGSKCTFPSTGCV